MEPVTTFQALLDDAATEASAFVSCPELVRAVAHRTSPPVHLAVFGRRGVGKSSLVRALTGADVPVGLGGVTREAARWSNEAFELVDLPGAEDPHAAAAGLRSALPSIDAVVWVIDGLAPISELERQVLDQVLAPHVGLHALVGRADLLDAAEHDAVLDRVAALTRPRAPLTIAVVDARDPRPDVRASLQRVDWSRSPRRLAALVRGLRAARQALDHLPEPIAASDIAENAALTWRDAVRGALAVADREVLGGRYPTVDAALGALHRALVDAAASLDHDFQATVSVPFAWRPTPPDGAGVDLRLLLSGTALVRRELRAYAAAQAGDGEIACLDLEQSPAGRALEDRRRAYRRAYRLVSQALRGIGGRVDGLAIG